MMIKYDYDGCHCTSVGGERGDYFQKRDPGRQFNKCVLCKTRDCILKDLTIQYVVNGMTTLVLPGSSLEI